MDPQITDKSGLNANDVGIKADGKKGGFEVKLMMIGMAVIAVLASMVIFVV